MRYALMILLLLGCGDDTQPGPADSGAADAPGGTDGPHADAPTVDAPSSIDGPEGGDGGATMHTLTLNNTLSWCTVSVNGGTSSTAASRTFMFPAGTVVNLHGDTADSTVFVWGFWTGTDGDTTANHDHNMSTTVTMSSDKTVVACCPDIGQTTCP